jgi:hypothetical protein
MIAITMRPYALVVVVLIASCGRVGFGDFFNTGDPGNPDTPGSDGSGNGPFRGDDGGVVDMACSALDQATCQQTPGCAPEMCPACPCGSVTFTACAPIATAQRPSTCPALGCSCCSNDSECGAPLHLCEAVIADPRCNKACGTDCPGACGPLDCSLPEGNACLGCASAADCPLFDACYSNACTPRTCATDDDCPADEECDGSGCTATSCGSDADCFGSCINDRCASGAGSCAISNMPG